MTYEERLLEQSPQLIVRIATICSNENVSVPQYWFNASVVNLTKLQLLIETNPKIVWDELMLLMVSDKPSLGIEFLRVSGALDILLPELVACFGVDQNPDYHEFDVYHHCIYSCDKCNKDNPLVRFCALIHDIGKPIVKMERSGRITFHKHEVLSVKLTRRVMSRFKVSSNDADFITGLVANHMYQYDRVWKDSTVMNFVERVGLTDKYLDDMSKFPLFQLRHADRSGRGLPPNTEKQNDFEKRIISVLDKIKSRQDH